LVGGGLGGAIPGGEVSDGVHFGDLVSAFMLGRLDAGYRFNEHFLFGAYVEGGTGAINTSDALAICDADGVDCSAGLVRLGLQARAYLSTQSRLQPWGGAGFGYEWFSFSARDAEYDDSVTVLAKGAELLRLTLGLDFWATERNLVSVLVGYALGKYGEVTYTDSVDGSTDLDGRTHHSVTLLATYNFMLSTR